jgi:RNA polymerase sigma-70 factor (ECF subfamily)
MALPYFFLPDHDESFPDLRSRGREGRGTSGRQLPEDSLDRERVLRIRAGDEVAYAKLFTDLHVALREFATTYVGSAALAEEIVQDVFLDLWIRRADWAPSHGIRAYLFRAVRNRATDTMRHQKIADQRRSLVESESGGAGGEVFSLPGADADIREFALALHAIFRELPSARRRAAFLRWRHGLTFAEIAEVMGTSVASVTMHVQRAREAVRPVIEKFTAE